MRTGDYIRHLAYRDVCIRVVSCRNHKGTLKVKGVFYNCGFEKSWCMNYTTEASIPNNERKYWLWHPSTEECLRHVNWKSL
jgi:hypothetical protein